VTEPRDLPAPVPTNGGPTGRWSDHAVEQLVGRLLQIGVLIATVVVLTGGAMLLAMHGHEVTNFKLFRGESSTLRSVTAAIEGARSLDARGIVQLGLVLLIATPVARVALTLVAFVLQKDRLYVALTAIVLVLLLAGLFA
jgi:uncharacterized membrane protein